MGNDSNFSFSSGVLTNFNPRSRVGNDANGNGGNIFEYIISIHVPAWGTTVPAWLYFVKFEDFNPRSRVGNDESSGIQTATGVISIHVPAWGTTPRGCCVNIAVEFQSTFPRGERPREIDFVTRFENFNPRSRVGNDDSGNEIPVYYWISIHVPAWGTTVTFKGGASIDSISIHVPAWGTTKQRSMMLSFPVFQSTFPRGERLLYIPQRHIFSISIHVPAWGTTGAISLAIAISGISIHVPAWGTTTGCCWN